ncbi:hypothetical protein BDB01DRAFT_708197, partial [Pilobolus umbonatus]
LNNIRFLVYADDVCVFLLLIDNHRYLRHHLFNYSKVSNSKINIDKTEVIFLNTTTSLVWVSVLSADGISKYHNRLSPTPLFY